ncbi:LOW QUALITY PROTEIN: sialidase-3 [Rhinatrema bivittatum]|uniref:LOW QUALITY PROTEIN: sialidase-3 n=1 Tax=Rhinatrema bivittatum TaxID=194408 RepID=UPI001129D5A5|nr:LOW QUALITY PROTEIN: sialidase-3 [Rhinatrema bivittatum]
MAAAALSAKTTLFRQEAGGTTYRIPALLYIKETGTFLAFAEKRRTHRDADAEYLVMRRGLVQGDTVKWESMTPLTSAVLPCHRTMNPCPVYETRRRVVFLFFICVHQDSTERCQILYGKNEARLCYVSSEDHGVTWSQLTDLTQEAIGEDIANWATFAVGPGHGVQLQCGRLIVPAYMYYIHAGAAALPLLCFTRVHSFVFYSDDLGESWHYGRLLGNRKTGECEVAELLCNGSTSVLYCSARTVARMRAEALSWDLGLTFETPSLCKQLSEPPHGCQGSVVSFLSPEEYRQEREDEEERASFPHKDNVPLRTGIRKSHLSAPRHTLSWLIFSHPTNRRKREGLGIYLNKSPLTPDCWDPPWIINKGPSGYSDLAACEGSLAFGCLFECGSVESWEEIAFQKVSLEMLLRNGMSCASHHCPAP